MELNSDIISTIINTNPGDYGIYRLRDGRLEGIYASPGLAALSGMTAEEYNEIVRADATNIVLECDRELIGLKAAQLQNDGCDADITYRIKHKTQGFVWVHARARRIGLMDGCPVLMTVFFGTSSESEEHSVLLGNTSTNIYVVDTNTKELLYANEPAMRSWGHGDYGGCSCHEYINGLEEPCPWCCLPDMEGDSLHVEALYLPTLRKWYRLDCRQMSWHGRAAVAIYAVDITRRVERQRSLETDMNELENILSSVPGGVCVFSEQDGVIKLVYTNDGFFGTHCGSREFWQPFMDENILYWIYEQDREGFLRDFERVSKGSRQQGSATYRVRGEDGRLHWINNQFRRAYDKDGVHYYYSSFACIDEQKNAEERLEESQSALREAMANSDVQFFTYFPGQRRCRVYAVSSRMGDMPTKWDNFPDDFLRFVHAPQDSAQAYRDMLQRIDAGADDAECIVRFAGSGQYTWEKVSVRAVRDREGRTVRAQGHSINITQRKTAEERLRQERARLKSLEGNIVEACSFSVASLGDWKSASKGTAEPGGESTPDAGGVLAAIAEQIPDQNERERFAAALCGDGLKKACAEGRFSQTFEYRRCLNGALRCVSTSVEVLPDPETGDNVAFLYTRDVHDETVRRRLDELIVTRNYVTVAYCDLCTGLLHVKSACGDCNAALDGLAYEEAMTAAVTNNADKAAAQTIRGELALSKVRAALEDDPVYTVYFSLDRHDDKLPGHPCVRVKCDIFYLDERRDVLAILISDVTAIFEQNREHREKMASALAAAEQASVAKTEFLSRMSHEIRTPMNAIIGLDAIALQEKDISPAMEDHLQKIGISARFLLSLINDILDMSRIESGRMMLKNEDFDFEELINGINTIMYEQCRDSGLDYDCVLKSYTEESFVGDKIKLQQVLVNILGNAVKFTPRGGKVHFMIEQVLRTREKATLRFEISDTGIGIDEKFIPHMFEAFSQENRGRTSAYGGTGLGLSISRNIVNLMGGDITVHSIKNVGTEFTVEVELGLSQKTINRRGLISPDKLLPLLTLVVDDDVIVCRHTQMLLCDAGLKAEWIDSGMGAIQKVTEHHEQERDYDLILLDWKMPDMDGIETARRIRRIVGPEVTIIIMTAYDWADIEKKARAAGVDMFMKKPVFASSVTRAFENVFLDKWTSHEPEEKQEYDFTGRRVLLAEDNEINAEIAKNILEMRGCDVEIAENGAAAIEAFAASGVGHFDAILMDVRMPVMDGLEAAKAIRAMKKADSKTVPIIAMTANAFQEDVNMSLEAGMNAHLAKPIDPDLLYETIEKFINSCRDR